MTGDEIKQAEEVGSVTTAIVEKIDRMVESGNLTTREGQSLMITVFREGMVTVGKMSKRQIELEAAYVRFANAMSDANTIEQENHKLLAQVLPVFQVVKWVGGALGLLILTLLWQIITGKVTISW